MAEHPEDDAPEDLANSSEDPVDCGQALPLSPEPAVKVQHLVYYGSLKLHKYENFFGFDFEFCPISLLVMHK